jgi:hypothetical protein
MKYHSYCPPLLLAYRQAGKAGLAGRLPASLDGCFFSQFIHSMNREIPHFSELRMVE